MWAVEQLGAQAELCWHGDATINGVDAVVRAGRLRARRLPAHRRAGALLAGDDRGHRVRGGGRARSSGICNGFQVLTEAAAAARRAAEERGLEVPVRDGRAPGRDDVDRAHRTRARSGSGCASRSTTSRATTCATTRTLDRLRAEDRVVVRYTDNPNGSLDDIAGICNAEPQRRRAHAASRARVRRDARLGRRRGAVAVAARGRGRPRRGVSETAPHRRTRSATPSSPASGSRSSPTRSRRRPGSCSPISRRCSRATSSTWVAGPGTRPRSCATRFPHSEVTGPRLVAGDGRRGTRSGARRVVRGRRRDRAAAAAGRRRVLAVAARPPARSGDRARALGRARCARPGLIVCEEPVRYRSDDPLFARYEAAVTAVVAARGATLWAGPVLDARSARLRPRARPGGRAPGARRPRRGDVLAQRGDVGRRGRRRAAI